MRNNAVTTSVAIARFNEECLQGAVHNFVPEQDPIRGFWQQLHSSGTTLLQYTVSDEEALWSAPSVGLLLSDTLVLSGASLGGENTGVLLLTEGRSVPKARRPHGHRKGFLDVSYGYCYLDTDQLLRWLAAAEGFINEGRLIYLPREIRISFGGGFSDSEQLWVSKNLNDLIDEAYALRGRAELLLSEDRDRWNDMPLLTVALPYLNGLSMKLLHKIMTDEHDAFVRFRGALAQIIPACRERSQHTDDVTEISTLGAELKRHVIEPELAQLNQRLRKIVATRSIRLAGGIVGIVGLGVAAMSMSAFGGAVSTLLGAGGAGLITKEIADYMGDLHALKDSPWYFAWRLKKSKIKQRGGARLKRG
jgi:hypothetical protein